jgi:hypothetical protein
MKLFHFTRRITLPSILTDGLSKGDTPLGKTTSINAVNLTSRDTPPQRVLHTGLTGEYGKTAIRIAVEIDPSDGALLPWAEYPDWFRISPGYFRRLNSVCDEGKPLRDWFLYLGTIPASRFVEIYDRYLGRQILPSEWPLIACETKVTGRLLEGIHVLPIHEAIRPRRAQKAAQRFPVLRGHFALAADDPETAIHAYLAAADCWPDDAAPFHNAAMALAKRGRWNEAAAVVARAPASFHNIEVCRSTARIVAARSLTVDDAAVPKTQPK